MAAGNVPQVNLLTRPSRVLGRQKTPRVIDVVLVVFVIAIWGSVGMAVAMLLGWHPQLELRL